MALMLVSSRHDSNLTDSSHAVKGYCKRQSSVQYTNEEQLIGLHVEDWIMEDCAEADATNSGE